MKSEKKKPVEKPKAIENSYRGSQLLKMQKYNNRVARIVIDADKSYTFAEADTKIENYGKRGN